MLFSESANIKLKQAFELYSISYCKSLPNDSELSAITFSKAFEEKMQKLLSRQKKSYYYLINTVGKRAAIIILTLLIGLTVTTFSVKALREAVLEFFTQIFDTHTDITITDGTYPIAIEFKKTQPQYIPEGFEITINEDYEESCRIVYQNSENITINYLQHANDNGGSLSADTEDVEFETIYINSLEGIKYHIKGLNKIVFGNEEYFFTLRGEISMEELIKMAESIPIN